MMVQPSLSSPAAAPLLMRSVPLESGPLGVVPNVMNVLRPALLAFTVLSAPMTRWRTVELENSVASMSMSIAFSLYAVMTFWYAPASADADEHFSPSLLPLQPPKDTTTSPPAARMALIFDWSSPPASGREPSHSGLQPPSESMNASVRYLTPVADMTVAGFCGLPQPKYS